MGAAKRAIASATAQPPRDSNYYKAMDWDEYDDAYGWYAWGPDQDEVLAAATAAIKGDAKPDSNTPSKSYVNQG